MTCFRRMLATVAAVLVLIAMWPGQRMQALPASLLMFYGEPLKKSVLVTGDDARAFGDLQRTGSTPPSTTGRAFIAVAIFYGPPSNPAVNGVPVEKLTPQMAWQHGRYYPATADLPAMLLVTRMDTKAAQGMPGPNAMFVDIGPLSS